MICSLPWQECDDMQRFFIAALLIVGLAAACSDKAPADTYTLGGDVTVTERDGKAVSGRLVEVTPDALVVEETAGSRTTIPRDQVSSVGVRTASPVQSTTAEVGANSAAEPMRPQSVKQAGRTVEPLTAGGSQPPALAERPAEPPKPTWREVTIPSGSVLRVRLDTTVGSALSHVETPIKGTLSDAVVIEGLTALPQGLELDGSVIEATRSGKVQGVARVALRFDSITVDEERHDIRSAPISRVARTTKKKDATKIGIGAGAGAVIGGIIGGGKGAAIGAGTGAGAGTAVVMSTRGEEVEIPRGTELSVTLAEPLTIRVKI